MNESNEMNEMNENSSRRGRRGRGGRPGMDGPPPFARAMAGHRGGRRGGPDGFGAPWGRFPTGAGSFSRGRGRGRRSRGDVKAAVLALLAEEPMHGYQIIGELADRTGGAWRVSPGSIYPTLQVLEDAGLVQSQKAEGKRVFSLTDEGVTAAAAADERKPWEEVADEVDDGLVALRDEFFNVGAAAVQVANAGNDDQVATARTLLAETRRQLYLLLADVGTTPASSDPEGDRTSSESADDHR